MNIIAKTHEYMTDGYIHQLKLHDERVNLYPDVSERLSFLVISSQTQYLVKMKDNYSFVFIP